MKTCTNVIYSSWLFWRRFWSFGYTKAG